MLTVLGHIGVSNKGCQNIDARKVAFIEKFTGQPWLQLGVSRFVGEAAGQTLEDVWETMVNRMADRLLVQGPWKSMFPNVEYDFESDRLILKNSFDDIISRAREYARTVDDSPLFWLKLANVLLHQKEDLGITVDRIKENRGRFSNTLIDKTNHDFSPFSRS